jgi:hypothetical protein
MASEQMQRLLAEEGKGYEKLFRVHSALQARLEEQGHELACYQEKLPQLQYLSHHEWVLKELIYLLCSCSNQGNLWYSAFNGCQLIAELEEVGLVRCAAAFRALLPYSRKEQELEERRQSGSVSGEEFSDEIIALHEAMEKIEGEANAEGDGEWEDILLAWVAKNQDEILPKKFLRFQAQKTRASVPK